jgi:hypothetical protein
LNKVSPAGCNVYKFEGKCSLTGSVIDVKWSGRPWKYADNIVTSDRCSTTFSKKCSIFLSLDINILKLVLRFNGHLSLNITF